MADKETCIELALLPPAGEEDAGEDDAKQPLKRPASAVDSANEEDQSVLKKPAAKASAGKKDAGKEKGAVKAKASAGKMLAMARRVLARTMLAMARRLLARRMLVKRVVARTMLARKVLPKQRLLHLLLHVMLFVWVNETLCSFKYCKIFILDGVLMFCGFLPICYNCTCSQTRMIHFCLCSFPCS